MTVISDMFTSHTLLPHKAIIFNSSTYKLIRRKRNLVLTMEL